MDTSYSAVGLTVQYNLFKLISIDFILFQDFLNLGFHFTYNTSGVEFYFLWKFFRYASISTSYSLLCNHTLRNNSCIPIRVIPICVLFVCNPICVIILSFSIFLYLSLSLSFSLAYLMNVFVLDVAILKSLFCEMTGF